MAFVTPRMSLKVWNSSSDPYDHEQLADNFLKLDIHDHTQGRGSQIPGAGIQPGAITAEHIYPGSIGGDALGEQSVSGDALQDDSVGNQQLHPNARIPVGTVLDWFCAAVGPGGAYTDFLPDGWAVCDGSTIPAGEHEIPGIASTANFQLPDLVGKVTMGANPVAALASAGSATTAAFVAPGVNGAAGSNLLRAVAAHSHTITHDHNYSHSHSLNVYDHSHGDWSSYVQPGTSGDSRSGYTAHNVTVNGRVNATSTTPGNANFSAARDGDSVSTYTHLHQMDHYHTVDNHRHQIFGQGNMDGGTDSQNTSVTGGTNTARSGDDGAHNVDVRMAYVGLLKIMKVRNV